MKDRFNYKKILVKSLLRWEKVSGRKLVFDLTDEAFQRLHPHPPQAVPLPLLGEGLMRIDLMSNPPCRLTAAVPPRGDVVSTASAD